MTRVAEWFDRLTALIRRIEAEKGSERIVAELVTDSFPAFTKGMALQKFAAARGIRLVHSPPYTHRLNVVERTV